MAWCPGRSASGSGRSGPWPPRSRRLRSPRARGRPGAPRASRRSMPSSASCGASRPRGSDCTCPRRRLINDSAAAQAGPAGAEAWLGRLRGGVGRRGRRLLLLGRLGALARPRLVELHPPLALLVLLEGEAGAERAPGTALEPGHRLGRAAGLDQLLGHGHRELLARLGLPDDEAAARVVPGPARVALAVLGDLAPAHRAGPELGARDAHVLELSVEVGDGLGGELGDVTHELRPRVGALLDQGEAVLPLAGQRGGRQRVLSEQADHVETLLGGHQRATVALEVADRDQALDDGGAGRRRADSRVLHRLAQLIVVDQLARGLHGAEQRGVAVAARRLGLLRQGLDLADLGALALLELGQALLAPGVVLVAVALGALGTLGGLAVHAAPARHEQDLSAGPEDVI